MRQSLSQFQKRMYQIKTFRVAIYKQFLKCDSKETLKEISSNLKDRYGRFNNEMYEIFKYLNKK